MPVIGKRYSRFAGARRRASRDSPTIPFMVTPRISYAHLLAEPNPKHVESLLKFFEAGRSKRGTGGLGVEIEHLPVHDADDTAVSYYEPNGIEAFLKRGSLRIMTKARNTGRTAIWSDSRAKALRVARTGGQVEASIGVLHEPATSTACTPTSGVRRTRSSRSWASVSSTTDTSRSRVSSTCRSIRKAAMTR